MNLILQMGIITAMATSIIPILQADIIGGLGTLATTGKIWTNKRMPHIWKMKAYPKVIAMKLKWPIIQYLVFSLIICFFSIPFVSLCFFDCNFYLPLPPKVASIILLSLQWIFFVIAPLF
jgi:hypothetical protein